VKLRVLFEIERNWDSVNEQIRGHILAIRTDNKNR